MPVKIFFFLSLCLSFGMAEAQKPPENQSEFEEAYRKRVQQEHLYGVYIPKDLADAFIQLNRLVDEESKDKFKSMPEQDATKKLFFSLGRWIIHNWGFYGGSRLSHYLRELGISHPEDMARFVILTYHRNLNRNSLDVKALVETFQAQRKQEQEKRLKEGTILYEETRKREKEDGGQ